MKKTTWKDKLKQLEDFEYITNPLELEDVLTRLEESKELALDTETYTELKWRGLGGSSLDPHTSRVSILSIKSRTSLPIVIDFIELERNKLKQEQKNKLAKFLERKDRLYAYNAKFDLKILRREFDLVLENFFCIRVLVKMITNALGSKFARKCGGSLQDVLRDYLDIHIEGKGKEQVSDWYPRPSEEEEDCWNWLNKVRYAASDIKYLFDLKDLLEPVVTNPFPSTTLITSGPSNTPREEIGLGMKNMLDLEMETQVAIAEMEWNGLPIALNAADNFYNSLRHPHNPRGELNRIGGELCQKLGIYWNLEEIYNLEYPIPKKHSVLRNPTNLRNLVRDKLGLLGLDTVQKDILNRLLDLFVELEEVQKNNKNDIDWASEEEADKFSEIKEIDQGMITEHTELIKLILRYKHLDKVMGMDLRNKINPVTKRVHASYDSIGASTSRTSSSCIAEGQRVLVPGDSKPIEEIKVGDYVYCYTDEGKPTISKVKRTFDNGVKNVVKVNWRSRSGRTGNIICTPDHKLRVDNSDGTWDWKRADQLSSRDKLYFLKRKDSPDSGGYRTRLYGIGRFSEREQTFIKREYFGVSSPKLHIHHIDHDTTNNSLDNLEILSESEHHSQHNKGLGWKELSKFSLLRMLAEAKGVVTKVLMDYAVFKNKCQLKGIDIQACANRYGKNGTYLSKANVNKALSCSKNTDEASKKLGIGTRRLKVLCKDMGITYKNHEVTSVEKLNKKAHVYCLNVENHHNFIVGELNVKNCPNAQQINGRVKVIVDRLLDEPLDQIDLDDT